MQPPGRPGWRCPARIRTRSVVPPSVPSGLATASSSRPWRTATAWDGQLIDDLGGHRRDRGAGEWGKEPARPTQPGMTWNVGGVAQAQPREAVAVRRVPAPRSPRPRRPAKQQRQPERRRPALPQPRSGQGATLSWRGPAADSADSTAAGLIRAAARPGHAAISAAATAVTGMVSSTSGTGMLAAGARPEEAANSAQAQRPASRPSGTPISRATAARLSACHSDHAPAPGAAPGRGS